ncbi:SAM-dependent RNA methyltransferase [Paenibacillus tianmuensis]|uniref:SAM-dependent RNA methyltransferase n=1 Tax=Paenibacillus tianmuensis TaxID=624147 RepID=A0A1G4SQP4_9BACL|nr:RNA methyltransferase [Paenibacillus tianmuensis]SCW71544.1 SAM-dependent RNA methyltransferase [Paenibacillus tianmuensis]
MKEKTILDIRIFEERGEHPSVFPSSYIGTLYVTDKLIHSISDRYARKLNELGFITGDYDHVYIAITPFLDEGCIMESELRPKKWMKMFYIGYPPAAFNQQSEDEKEHCITKLITKILKNIAKDAEQSQLVENVQHLLLRDQSELEIIHLTKETKTYKVTVSYQIRPLRKASKAIIEYWDKSANVKRKCAFQDLKIYSDIFYLVSSITVAEGVIMLKPRTSAAAQQHIRSYAAPITITIGDIPICHEQ